MPAQRGTDDEVAQRNKRCIQEGMHEDRTAGQTYSLAKDGQSIHCWQCGRTSYNMGDVQHLYCGCCQQFHDVLSRMASLS
jgi:hypothetical protein